MFTYFVLQLFVHNHNMIGLAANSNLTCHSVRVYVTHWWSHFCLWDLSSDLSSICLCLRHILVLGILPLIFRWSFRPFVAHTLVLGIIRLISHQSFRLCVRRILVVAFVLSFCPCVCYILVFGIGHLTSH